MQTLTDKTITEMSVAAAEAGDHGTGALCALALYGWSDMLDYIRGLDCDEEIDVHAWLDNHLPSVPRPLTMAQARATLAEDYQRYLDERASFADYLDAEDAMAEIEALPR